MTAVVDYAALANPQRGNFPRTVVGLLLNYRQTLEALGDAVNHPPYKAPPKAPVLYIKPANTYARDGDAITVPDDISEVVIGACLAVEFARSATRVREEDALDYVAGYRVVADLYASHDVFYRPPVKHKCRDAFCPIGALQPAARVHNPDDLAIRVLVDDQERQTATTRDLVRSARRAIADITEFMTLSAGDLLLLGIPEGAPRARPGQHYRIEIDQVGSLSNKLVRSQA